MGFGAGGMVAAPCIERLLKGYASPPKMVDPALAKSIVNVDGRLFVKIGECKLFQTTSIFFCCYSIVLFLSSMWIITSSSPLLPPSPSPSPSPSPFFPFIQLCMR